MYAITQPPSLEDAKTIFSESTTVEDRLRRLTKTLFDFYERGEAYLDTDHQERKLDSVKEWEEYLKTVIEELTRIALQPARPDQQLTEIMAALLDVQIFLSFRRRNMSRMQIETIINRLLVCLINDSSH